MIATFGLVLSLGLLACTETTSTSSGLFGDDVTTSQSWGVRSAIAPRRISAEPGLTELGSDQFFDPQSLSREAPEVIEVDLQDDEEVQLSLINASIPAATEAILGQALGLQYTVADDVNGRITIQTTGPVHKSVLVDLFHAALGANDAILKRRGRIYSVESGTTGNLAFRLARDGVASGATIIVAPLEHVSSSQFVSVLSELVPKDIVAIADQRRNLVLMSGSNDALKVAIDAVNLFDVDVLSGRSVAIVPLKAADPAEVVDELSVIMETQEGQVLDGVVEFVANARLNAILIVSSRSKYLHTAKRWILELDKDAKGSLRYTEVYPLANRDATEIASIAESLLQDVISSEPAEGTQAVSMDGTRIAADKTRNAVIVRASRAQHQEMGQIIKLLDQAQAQVLIEATIAEVVLNDQVELGVRWFFETGNFSNTFSDVTTGAVAANFPGFSSVFSSGSSEAVLNALSSVTDVRVISAPTLMVLDQKDATLQIGDQVPVATQTASSAADADSPTVTNVEYRDTGVILTVNPKIGSNGRVVLGVSQEISSVAATNTSGIDSPTFRQRRIETTVALNNGNTLVLGGLVRETDNVTETKVPGLGDIPVLGNVFRSRDSSKERSELLILIRPRIVRTAREAQSLTSQWRAALSAADGLLETGLGPASHSTSEVLR